MIPVKTVDEPGCLFHNFKACLKVIQLFTATDLHKSAQILLTESQAQESEQQMHYKFLENQYKRNLQCKGKVKSRITQGTIKI